MRTVPATSRVWRWNRFSWTHPEWWTLCLCAAAWVLVLSRGASDALYLPASHAHAGHGVAAAELPDKQVALAAEGFWWLVMVVAMMFPMIVDPIRTTAARSLWRRRHRAIGGFLVGYAGPWILFGIATSTAVSLLGKHSALKPGLASGLVFGAAALWQFTPLKRRAVMACHRTQPIAPSGWHADRDCLWYGWIVGRSCLVSCWALMLACMLAGHSIPALVGATAIGWIERNRPRPNQRLLCAVIAGLALTYLIAPNL